MIQLSQEEKSYVLQNIKPMLQKGKAKEVVRLLARTDGQGFPMGMTAQNCKNILAWLLEHKVNILGNIDKIPDKMFTDSDISMINIPGNIKYIGDYAFQNCHHLTSVTLAPGIEEIGRNAFANSGIAKIEIPEGVEILLSGTFTNCKNLSTVFLPDSLITIQNDAFLNAYDGITIYLNSRKNMPKQAQLRIPTSEIEWYKQHVQIKTV